MPERTGLHISNRTSHLIRRRRERREEPLKLAQRAQSIAIHRGAQQMPPSRPEGPIHHSEIVCGCLDPMVAIRVNFRRIGNWFSAS